MAQSYRFTIGDITCIALVEGKTVIDPDGLSGRYPNATEEEIQATLEAYKTDDGKVYGYYNVLYVKNGETQILFDAGMGYRPERPQIGKLLASLDSEGISPADIDMVFITHFHGDHYLGLLTDGEPTFPNARYLTRDEEWAYWLDNDDKAMAQRVESIKQVVEPLQNKFSTVSAGDEIADGVSVMAIPGHTMGQSAIRIASGDEIMIHMVDLLHHPSQFTYPHWQFVYDTDGDLAVETRKAQLNDATTHQTLLMFYHLPFPGLGHVERAEPNFKWVPLTT